MKRVKALFLLCCFCLPFLLAAAGCEQEPKQHTIYREKVEEDKVIKKPDFVVE